MILTILTLADLPTGQAIPLGRTLLVTGWTSPSWGRGESAGSETDVKRTTTLFIPFARLLKNLKECLMDQV